MERKLKFKNQEFIVDLLFEVDYTSVSGKQMIISSLGVYDPRFYEEYSIRTLKNVYEWWVDNREKLEEDLSPGVFSNLTETVRIYFDFAIGSSSIFSYTKEEFRERMYGNLSTDSLMLNLGGSSQSFKLVQQGSKEQVYILNSCRFLGELRLDSVNGSSVNRQASVPQHWLSFHSYSYKMEPETFKFFRKVKYENDTMFGVELEICTSLTIEELQYIVCEIEPKQEPFFIGKSDSSISGRFANKIELVTVPCSPRYLRTNFKLFFNKIEELCTKKGKLVSDYFDTSRDLSNGLHIHVSNDSFMGSSFNSSGNLHKKKFILAFNQFNKSSTDLLQKVSGRPRPYKSNNYCPIDRNLDGMIFSRRLKNLTSGRSGDRCVAHSRSGNTVEVRLFQGIFDLAHVMRCISFTEAIFEYCSTCGFSDFDANFKKGFTSLVEKNRKFFSLKELLV